MTRRRRAGTLADVHPPRRSADRGRRAPAADLPALAAAIERLPADERRILRYASSSGWSVDRIAGHVGMPPDVVKRRLHDALARLLGPAVSRPPGTP